MNKKGVVMLNEELTEDWVNTLGECGINSLGLHSLYWHGGLDAHLNWLLDEDTQSLIEDCEKKGFTVEHQLHADANARDQQTRRADKQRSHRREKKQENRQ